MPKKKIAITLQANLIFFFSIILENETNRFWKEPH